MTCARLSEIDAVADARDTSEEQPGITKVMYIYFTLLCMPCTERYTDTCLVVCKHLRIPYPFSADPAEHRVRRQPSQKPCCPKLYAHIRRCTRARPSSASSLPYLLVLFTSFPCNHHSPFCCLSSIFSSRLAPLLAHTHTRTHSSFSLRHSIPLRCFIPLLPAFLHTPDSACLTRPPLRPR